MVRGEETNVFSNTLGKTVVVEVCSTSAETTQLLAEVLDDDAEIAELLASEIHKEITLDEVPVDINIASCDFDIDIDDLGIWIDPIGKFLILKRKQYNCRHCIPRRSQSFCHARFCLHCTSVWRNVL